MHFAPARVAPIALFCLLAGCIDRSASQVDPAEPVADAESADRRVGDGPPADLDVPAIDATLDAASPDVGPTDASIPDASRDLAGPDAGPDAALARPTEPIPLFAHAGRAGCPDAVSGPDGWTVAWTAGEGVGGPGDTIWAARVDPDGTPRPPAPIDALDGQTVVGPIHISQDRGDVQLAGASTAGGRAALEIWLAGADGGRRGTWRPDGEVDPDAIAMAQHGDETWVLHPRGDRLVLVWLDSTGEILSEADVGPVADAVALAAVEPELVALARVDDGLLSLSLLFRGRGSAWAAALPVARPEFDLSVHGRSIALVYLAEDPALDALPFGAGYGRPELLVFAVEDGTRGEPHRLSPTVVRGDRPTVARYGDGWLTAWSRLRVDADRNRTEIEATISRADGRPLLTPRRLTRAHGFSFCPVAADGGDRAFVAWLDTRDGAEDIYAAVGHPSLWPAADASPEPGASPAGFPDDCAEPSLVTEDFTSSLQAVPTDDGLSAIYSTLDGELVAIDIDREGRPTPRARWAPGGEVDALFTARSGAAWAVGATVDGAGRVWRIDAGEAMPVEGQLDDGPLVGLTVSPRGVSRVTMSPAGIRTRFSGPGPGDVHAIDIEGTVGVVEVAVGGGDAGSGIAWVDPEDGTLAVRRFDAGGRLVDGPWADRGLPVGDLIDLADLDVAVDAEGLWVSASAHRGRPFARRVYMWRIDGQGMPTRLDVDPASSRGPRSASHAPDEVSAWWIDVKPIQRFEAQMADRIGDGPPRVRRLPIPGPGRIEFFVRPDGDDAVVLWRAGVQLFSARYRSACLPTARFVP